MKWVRAATSDPHFSLMPRIALISHRACFRGHRGLFWTPKNSLSPRSLKHKKTRTLDFQNPPRVHRFFWAQNSLFGRFHHVCTRSCGVQKCVGRTHLRFSVSEFPDAHFWTRKNQVPTRLTAKQIKKKTAFFANSQLRYVTQLGLFFDEKCLFFIIHI